MNKSLAVLFAMAAAMFMLFPSSGANAQASRTWVSGVGDDANPCSRTAPCKTFAGAISKTAVNGEINCIDPGGFGAVTITKSITIDCRGAFGSILNAGTNAINIAFDSFATTDARKTVNIRNINTQGFDSGIIGVRIFGVGTGSSVTIEDCVINGNFSGTAAGIADQRSSGRLTVLNTTVRNNGSSGIAIQSAGGAGLIQATLSNVKIVNSANGISMGAGTNVHVGNSLLASNTATGISVTGGGASINSSTFAMNGIAIKQSGPGTAVLSNSDFSFNTTALSGTVSSHSNNRTSTNGSGGTITVIGTTTNPTGLQ